MNFSESLRNHLTPWVRRGSTWYQHAESWYRQRPPREQRLLTIAAGIATTALVFVVLIDPAWSTMTRAQRELPDLRGQAATVADLTAQVRALRRQGGNAARNTAPSIDELSTSLRREGLNEDTWSLSEAPATSVFNVSSNGQASQAYSGQDLASLKAITLTLHEASASALFRWLDTSARDWRLTVIKAELNRARHATGRRLPGQLSGTLVLMPAPKS